MESNNETNVVQQVLNAVRSTSKERIAQLKTELAKSNKNVQFVYNHYESLFEKTKHLTIDKFVNDLRIAKQFEQHRYWKNDAGLYIYVRGIEIDGSCELMRGGMNAEDRGVYIHYVAVDKISIVTHNAPIIAVSHLLHEAGKEQLHVCSKDDYDAAKVAVLKHTVGEPECCEQPSKYLNAYEEYLRAIDKRDSLALSLLDTKDMTKRETEYAALLVEVLCELNS